MPQTGPLFIRSSFDPWGWEPSSFTAPIPPPCRWDMIPEANGVQLKDGFLSVTVPIGLDPVRRSFSLNLTATGDRHRRLTARVSEPLPPGLVFTIEISSRGFGRSLGPKTIGTAETDLLDGVCLAWRKEVRGTLTARAENIMPRSSGGAELVFSLR